MKTVYVKEFGGPENLEYREVDDPAKPHGTEILVRVRASGLNRADLLQRRGLYPPPSGYSPNIPGLEFAGEVEKCGDAVSNFKKGDRVFGITAGEAHAEKLIVDASLAIKIPDNLNFIEAAAIPEVFITAHDAVFTQADLKKGETLLIHAVGSGVGLAGLQLGNAFGARVIGTSRTADKLARCKEFGLDEPIFTENGMFAEQVLGATGGRGANVILDLVGGAYFEENLKCLATKGRMMLVGLTAGSRAEFDLGAALRKRVTIIGTTLRGRPIEEKAEAIKLFASEVVPLFAEGRLVPNIDRVFPAADVSAAHEYLESNESFGKVILEF
jgi:putative PIG3 family NAD(P)H quinone oxidoreductase